MVALQSCHSEEHAAHALPVAITGLGEVRSPRFAQGERLTFLAQEESPAAPVVPWIGRLVAVDKDISIKVTEIGKNQPRRFAITVRNEGFTPARNIRVVERIAIFSLSGKSELLIAELAPGQEVHLFGTFPAGHNPKFLAVSDEIRDRDPGDNLVTVFDAESSIPRRRAVR